MNPPPPPPAVQPNRPARHYDAIVLGAGIVGAACAHALALAGLHVAVVERHGIGHGDTSAGMGHIVAMDDSPAQLALTRYGQTLWDGLAPNLPPAAEFQRCGTLWIAATDAELAEAQRKQAVYAAHNIPTSLLDANSLANAEPNLSPFFYGALHVPSDSALHPTSAAQFLLDQALLHRTELFLGHAALAAAHGRVLLDDNTQIHAPILINATGVFAPSLTPGIPVRRRKGHLVLTGPRPGFVHHQLVELGYLASAHATLEDSVAFNVQPRLGGQLCIGSSRQFDAETSTVDETILAAMLARAASYLPGIETLSTQRVWTGFRAATPDKLPLIGPAATHNDQPDPTLFLATGHEGLGGTTALATAQLLAGHILNRPTAIPIAPYLPARFAQLHP
jgi:D-hydroxyproline dehydrogenase subunit beta